MAALEHIRHEMFCNFVARGNAPLTAYVAAGYAPNKAAALALLKIKVIAARIKELKPFYHEKYRTRVSPRTILKQRREEQNA